VIMKKTSLARYLAAILFLIVLDQASKSFLIDYLKTQPSYILELAPMLDLVYAWNYGISFGFLGQYHQYSNIAFLCLNSLIISYLTYLLYQTKTCAAQIGLALIIGGALGNLADRIFRGAVFDFIYLHYNDLGFAAFNLADSFITIGACFFMYDHLFAKEKEKEK